MRKGMKAFAAVLAVATASTMSLTAFAAPSVSVSTSYSGDNVTVTASVTGAATSEQVAFLVHKTGETPSNTSIYYIDQKQADQSGAVTFSFTDSKDKIVNATGSTVKVGTTSTANSTDTTDTTTLKLTDFTITYSSEGNGTAYAIVSDAVNTTSSVTTSGDVTFAVTANLGYTFEKVTVNETEKSGVNPNKDNLLTLSGLKDNDVVKFYFKAVEATVTPTATTNLSGNTVTYDASATASNSMFTYGKAAGAIKEAGMFIATTEAALTAQKSVTDGSLKTDGLGEGTRIGKFQALGFGSDGSFAIELKEDLSASSKPTDYTNFITSGTMYAMTYIIKSDNTAVYGDIVTITAN